MTQEEAIKYLKQLYPNGGHCWLDEQRIEAIGIAVKALQEEPVSEELEEAAALYINDFIDGELGFNPRILSDDCSISDATMELELIFKDGAQWMKEKLSKQHKIISQ